MPRWLLERRLATVSDRLRRVREELAVVDEQLADLSDHAADAELRSLVSETPLAGREHHDAQRHADAMATRRRELVASIAQLEHDQDVLLDRFIAERR